MPKFEDLLGGPKMYTEAEVRETFLDIFMVGIELMADKLDLEQDDVEAIERWYSEKYVEKVIERTREKLTEAEFNMFVEWQRSDLAKKAVGIQNDVMEMLTMKLQLFIGARMQKKLEEI